MFGKPWPSSRSKNIALAKEELNRYVSYCPVHEIDPTEKRKKPVVITELHNPPLPARETQRRRHGTYIDLLRPLLLSQQSYDRKIQAIWTHFVALTEFPQQGQIYLRLLDVLGGADVPVLLCAPVPTTATP